MEVTEALARREKSARSLAIRTTRNTTRFLSSSRRWRNNDGPSLIDTRVGVKFSDARTMSGKLCK